VAKEYDYIIIPSVAPAKAFMIKEIVMETDTYINWW